MSDSGKKCGKKVSCIHRQSSPSLIPNPMTPPRTNIVEAYGDVLPDEDGVPTPFDLADFSSALPANFVTSNPAVILTQEGFYKDGGAAESSGRDRQTNATRHINFGLSISVQASPSHHSLTPPLTSVTPPHRSLTPVTPPRRSLTPMTSPHSEEEGIPTPVKTETVKSSWRSLLRKNASEKKLVEFISENTQYVINNTSAPLPDLSSNALVKYIKENPTLILSGEGYYEDRARKKSMTPPRRSFTPVTPPRHSLTPVTSPHSKKKGIPTTVKIEKELILENTEFALNKSQRSKNRHQ